MFRHHPHHLRPHKQIIIQKTAESHGQAGVQGQLAAQKDFEGFIQSHSQGAVQSQGAVHGQAAVHEQGSIQTQGVAQKEVASNVYGSSTFNFNKKGSTLFDDIFAVMPHPSKIKHK